MKSTCPHCGTTYRIDPRKVPSGGVQARCSRCGGVFRVQASLAPASSPAPASRSGPVAAAMAPTPAPAAPPPAPVGDARRSRDGRDYQGQVDLPELTAPSRPAAPEASPQRPGSAGVAPPLRVPEPPSPDRPAVAPAGETGSSAPPRSERSAERPAANVPRPPPLFGRPDPHGKARRLARALISDIAVYNPERRDRGIDEGTLRQEFREEIRRSWDEYVAQVGESTARSTPYFREALNEILAGGRAVF